MARLLRLRGWRAKQSRRYKSTTKRNKAHPVAPNLLKRDFVADQPDQKRLSDSTYIPTAEGWLYLAAILDQYYVYHTRNQVKTDVFFYIESFYNRRRRHSALDYLSPEAYEQLYHQRLGLA